MLCVYVSPLPLYELIMEIQNTQEIERTLCVLDLFSEHWQSTVSDFFFFFGADYDFQCVCVCVHVCVCVWVCMC